ncbi:MAG: DNA-methyltransferase, partial [Fimbriimonadales bacterium]
MELPRASSVQPFLNRIVHGDCREVLTQLPDACVDLIITSPPYADQRREVYGGVHPDHYVEWFLPIAAELKRVLKPTGSFILNIKERVVDGERHPYVLRLILAMREQGWRWTEEYIWHKKNCYPGKWPNRFPRRDPSRALRAGRRGRVARPAASDADAPWRSCWR